MKKLLFVFVALMALVLTSGCGTKQNTVRFNSDGQPIEKSGEAVSDKKEDAVNDGEADEATATKDKTEETTIDKTVTSAKEIPTGKLSVTSFDGGFLKTTYSYNVVKGTVPTGTKKITINDYKLSKYIGGQTQWDYIASTRFGTLKSGLNTYVVKTFDAKGEETDSLIFTINYDAPATPVELPGVGANLWLSLLTTIMVSGAYAMIRKNRWL
jgi:hypothetical protein